MRGGFFHYFAQFIERLPVQRTDFVIPPDRSRHDQMICLVEQLLALHQRQAAARTSYDKQALARQIAALDRQLNRLV